MFSTKTKKWALVLAISFAGFGEARGEQQAAPFCRHRRACHCHRSVKGRFANRLHVAKQLHPEMDARQKPLQLVSFECHQPRQAKRDVVHPAFAHRTALFTR